MGMRWTQVKSPLFIPGDDFIHLRWFPWWWWIACQKPGICFLLRWKKVCLSAMSSKIIDQHPTPRTMARRPEGSFQRMTQADPTVRAPGELVFFLISDLHLTLVVFLHHRQDREKTLKSSLVLMKQRGHLSKSNAPNSFYSHLNIWDRAQDCTWLCLLWEYALAMWKYMHFYISCFLYINLDTSASTYCF